MTTATFDELLGNIDTINFLQTAQFFVNLTDPDLELFSPDALWRPTSSLTKSDGLLS